MATVLSACGGCYMVRAPQSGATYYTKDVDHTGDAGAIEFKDEATGLKVAIQQSEMRNKYATSAKTNVKPPSSAAVDHLGRDGYPDASFHKR